MPWLSDIFGNSTTPLVGWQREPNTRGTFSILSTCLVTLLLCVWSAVHTNPPAYRPSEPQREEVIQLLRRVGWLAGGLIAPEYLAFTAWRDLVFARETSKSVNALFGDGRLQAPEEGILRHFWRRWRCWGRWKVDIEERIERAKRERGVQRHRWTTAHGFYLQQGGFVVDTTQGRDPYLPLGMECAVVDGEVLRLLVESETDQELIPDIPLSEIRDKSKSDGLAKLLVSIQLSWFGLQFLNRLVQSAAITLLELNVFCHCLASLISLLCWYHKPRGIETHTVITGRPAQILLQYAHWGKPYARNRQTNSDYGESEADVWHRPYQEPEPAPKVAWADTESDDYAEPPVTLAGVANLQEIHGWALQPRMAKERIVELPAPKPGGPPRSIPEPASLWRTIFTDPRSLLAPTATRWYAAAPAPSILLSTTPAERVLWSETAYRKIYNRQSYNIYRRDFSLSLLKPGPKAPIRTELMRRNADLGPRRLVYYRIGVSIASALYAAAHLLAWNGAFGSPLDRLFWRGSAITVGAAWPLTVAALMLFVAVRDEDLQAAGGGRPNRWILGSGAALWWNRGRVAGRGCLLMISGVAFVGLLVIYTLARGYLVVSAFVQLLHVPVGAFSMPSWTPYWPHVS